MNEQILTFPAFLLAPQSRCRCSRFTRGCLTRTSRLPRAWLQDPLAAILLKMRRLRLRPLQPPITPDASHELAVRDRASLIAVVGIGFVAPSQTDEEV
jgi:hypothetical protein